MYIDAQTHQVTRAYHAARTAGDLEAASAHLAPTFTFQIAAVPEVSRRPRL